MFSGFPFSNARLPAMLKAIKANIYSYYVTKTLHILTKPYQVGTVIILILQMGKLRLESLSSLSKLPK